jgi:hypothetical protein
MRFTRPGLSEAIIAAHFEYLCSLSGSQRPAYVPVVASGYVVMLIPYRFFHSSVLIFTIIVQSKFPYYSLYI